MIESLRAGSDRLNADLRLLEGHVFDMPGMSPPPPVGEPAPVHAPEPGAAVATEPAAEAVEFQEVIGDPEHTHGHDNPESVHGNGDDHEGARLIALNMALNGTPRDETARYLSENFQLSDAGGLLDEVYASVEG